MEGAGGRAASPQYDHAHAASWFSQLNRDWGLVESAVRKDIQLDRHAKSSHYLYVDGHVAAIAEATILDSINNNRDFALPNQSL
jgi:prepilin-type processing-associated H-X9-DG protein